MTTTIISSLHNKASWLQARREDVTASQIGALFGVHDFITPYQLWLVKAGLHDDVVEETAAMERGKYIEPMAVQYLKDHHPGMKIEHNAASFTYYRDPEHRLGATPDVIAHDERGIGIIQIKSVEPSTFRKKWFDSAGDYEVPLWIALQATLEAHLVGANWAAVAPVVVGHGIEMPLIDVPLISGVIDRMREKVAAFWRSIEENDPPAPDFTVDGEMISMMYGDGDPDHEVDLSTDNRIPELIETRQRLLREIAAREAERDAIDAEVKSKIGMAHVAHIGGGKRITWKPEHRSGHFVPPTTTRPIRYARRASSIRAR